MDAQHYGDLRQLAATLRLSSHILERAPEQLENQIVGRIGQAPFLHNLASHATPLRLLSRSLRTPERGMLRILSGHMDRVTRCAFHPDGTLLVSASADKTLRLWEVDTGNCIMEFVGHEAPVTACVFSPDGHSIFSASEDKTLRWWDTASGALIHTFTGHHETVNGCAVTPDGKYLLSVSGGDQLAQSWGNNDNSFRLWNLETKTCEHIFEFPEELKDRIDTCAVSYDGKLAVTGEADDKLRLWDLGSKRCIHTVWSGKGDEHACTFIGNRYVVSATAEGAVQLWDFTRDKRRSKPVFEYFGHTDYVTDCAVFVRERPQDEQESIERTSDQYILSSARDNTLRLWNLSTGVCVRTLYGHTSWVAGCAVNRQGTLAASASWDNSLMLWDLDALLDEQALTDQGSSQEQETWNSLKTFWHWDDGFKGCAFSPDGRSILSAADWFTLELRERESDAVVQTFRGYAWVRCCTFSPDGKSIVAGYENGTLIKWDVATGESLLSFTGHHAAVWDCAFSRDGSQLLSASFDQTLHLWDAASGELQRVLSGHENLIDACALSPDGRFALSGARDWSVRIWDVQNGSCLHVLRRSPSGKSRGLLEVYGCAFSPDGKYAISGGADRVISLWNVATGEFIRAFSGHNDTIKCCVFHPTDSRYFASASDDRTVRLWSVESDRCLCTLRGHEKWVRSCAFSADGRLLLSKSDDGSIRLWDIADYLRAPQMTGHRRPVTCCQFSPDGRFALTGSEDGTLRLWDVAAQQVIRIFVGHEQEVLDCAFSPDGQALLSASRDGTLRLWNRETSLCERSIAASDKAVWGCAFSADGTKIIGALQQPPVLIIWDRATGTQVQTLKNLARSLTRYTFTKDGRYILSASRDWTLKRLDTARFEELPGFQGLIGPGVPEEVQRALTGFPSPSSRATVLDGAGQRAVSLFPPGVGIVWEVQSGREICQLQHVDEKGVRSLVYSPNGSRIIACTSDRHLRVWNAENGQEVGNWPGDDDLLACALHPDGKHILAGDRSGAVHFLLLDDLFPPEAQIDRNTPQNAPQVPRWQFWKKR